ncbi:MAG: hypothetical protein ABIL16_08110 [candidate division WOR-3 bacterium]
MKRFIVLLIASGLVAGCKKATTDEDEIRAILETDGLFNLALVYGGNPDTASTKTMGPQNWYRHIWPDSIIKTYNITVVGDSAFVHAIWTFKGQFRIITGYDPYGDSLIYVSKPLEDKAERNAIFKKIARRWRLVKISGVKFSPVSASVPFTIDSVVVISSSSGRKVFKDPLNEFLDTSQIFYNAGENVEVRVFARPLNSAYGYIHHWNNSHHRDAMIVDTAGYMNRTYAITTRPGRYNAIADLITIPSFDTSSSEYLFEAWGFPYIVR